MQKQVAVRCIENAYWKWKNKLRKCVNDTDFATFESIRGIRFFHENYQFDPISLYKYIIESGKCLNPYTRTQISHKQLSDLSHILAFYDIPPIVDQLPRIQRRIVEEQIDEDARITQALYQSNNYMQVSNYTQMSEVLRGMRVATFLAQIASISTTEELRDFRAFVSMLFDEDEKLKAFEMYHSQCFDNLNCVVTYGDLESCRLLVRSLLHCAVFCSSFPADFLRFWIDRDGRQFRDYIIVFHVEPRIIENVLKLLKDMLTAFDASLEFILSDPTFV